MNSTDKIMNMLKSLSYINHPRFKFAKMIITFIYPPNQALGEISTPENRLEVYIFRSKIEADIKDVFIKNKNLVFDIYDDNYIYFTREGIRFVTKGNNIPDEEEKKRNRWNINGTHLENWKHSKILRL